MIIQGQTTQFKVNLLSGLENFAVGTPYVYKIALYNANANQMHVRGSDGPVMAINKANHSHPWSDVQ